MLKWARAHGCPWEENIVDHPGFDCCALAARYGHLAVLKWLREQHCPWNGGACAAAAEGGHLEVLKWARGQDPPCPWDWKTCDKAVRGGHLEVLQWAREHGCQWSAARCATIADVLQHAEMARWVRAQAP